METIYDYFMAGYNLRMSERPPYDSSAVGMAFSCGVWCRHNNVVAQEIKASRGYTYIVNRIYRLNFKNNSLVPTVEHI